MIKNSDIRWKQLLESTSGEPLCIILSFCGTEVLLMNPVVMVAKLVNKHMQKHEGASLRLRESAHDAILSPVVRNTEPLKYLLMRSKILRGNLHPKVIRPSVKKNRPGLLAMVKYIKTVTSVAAARQHNALQSLGVPMPPWDDINELLHVSLADNVSKSTPQ